MKVTALRLPLQASSFSFAMACNLTASQGRGLSMPKPGEDVPSTAERPRKCLQDPEVKRKSCKEREDYVEGGLLRSKCCKQ